MDSMSSHDTWATLFECLKARPRRRLLTGLTAYEPPKRVHFTELRGDESAPGTPVYPEYIDLHLPKLAAAGYIRWNDQTHEISRGPRFREVESFIELLQTHSEQLPDRWV